MDDPMERVAARIIESIDLSLVDEIRARNADQVADHCSTKYLDVGRWVRIALARARRLGLDQGPRRRILDLGCGAGYFVRACRELGHEVLGLDHADRASLFREMTRLLDVDVVSFTIEPMRQLIDLGDFDLVSAYMVTFNGHGADTVWGIAEWRFFLGDVALRLRPNGTIYLELNREPSGSCFTPELEQFFVDIGAEIGGAAHHQVTFASRVTGA